LGLTISIDTISYLFSFRSKYRHLADILELGTAGFDITLLGFLPVDDVPDGGKVLDTSLGQYLLCRNVRKERERRGESICSFT
jgi:hypothetical protein